MTTESWTWVGAKAIGSSHVKAGLGCDDFGGCVEVATAVGPVLVAVASDGAGSAPRSKIGSRVVTSQMIRAAVCYLRRKHFVGNIDLEIATDWVDRIRDSIYAIAAKEERPPRDYSATMIAVMISPTEATIIHVGDGAAVTLSELDEKWSVPSWPMQGEYASTTYFVTDEAPKIRCLTLDDRINAVALFTDGIERLVLDFVKNEPSQAFFDKMITPLKAAPLGRARPLSKSLLQYLDSKAVIDRTDDDKTLILARRKGE